MPNPAPAPKPDRIRLRHGAILLAGAAAVELLVGLGPLAFHWTPLIVGVTYLGVAASGGRPHGHWATGIVLVAFGVTVVSIDQLNTGINPPAGYLMGAGIGGMVAAALDHRDFSVDSMGIAGAVTASGLFLFLADEYPKVLARGEAYAILLGLVGLANVVLAVRGPSR
jgi:hypothetical protein